MPVQYKLTYFDLRAVAEPIRLIFTLAGVPFEEERIPFEKWAEIKPTRKIGFGQMPVLHVDGKQLTQSLAIGRYLAREFGLLPKDSFTVARCDEIVDILAELRLKFISYFFEKDETKKAEAKQNLLEVVFPNSYQNLSTLVGERNDGPFVDGKNITWADLFLANWNEIYTEHLGSELTSKYPILEKHMNAVYEVPTIKKYLASRPKTFI